MKIQIQISIIAIVLAFLASTPVYSQSKSDAGSFQYNFPGKPYAIAMATSLTGAISTLSQTITYTSFKRPVTITEGGFLTTFTYNGLGDYELDIRPSGTKEKLYLGGDFYSAPAVFVKENTGNWNIYYICRDYLGSITHITNSSGSVIQELSYDAWGRLRNPVNQSAYNQGAEPEPFLGRGYTGHEHLTQHGLINMNARLYDPALGRFLSPDPFVQMPDFSQSYNRYSYALNNPFKYADADGEVWHIVIGAAVGGVVNLVCNWDNINGFWQGVTSFAVGAGAGAAVAATGGIAGAGFWATAGVAAAGGAVTAGTNNVIAQTGENFSGFNDVDWGQVGVGATIGGVAGFAGSAAGYWASNASFLVNGVSSPVLRSAVVSPLAAGVGHVAGGTTANFLAGQSLDMAFTNSFIGIGKNMALGGALGVATTIGVSYANKVSPWTGRSLNNNTNALSINSSVRTEPNNLTEQIALEAAKSGLGTEIMQGKINDTAWQGWQKIQYLHQNPDGSNIVIHYWRNPQTGVIIGFKFK